jgi:hypothetical protein
MRKSISTAFIVRVERRDPEEAALVSLEVPIGDLKLLFKRWLIEGALRVLVHQLVEVVIRAEPVAVLVERLRDEEQPAVALRMMWVGDDPVDRELFCLAVLVLTKSRSTSSSVGTGWGGCVGVVVVAAGVSTCCQ